MPSFNSREPWNADQRLDILVLGPMGQDADLTATIEPIRNAVESILAEPEFDALLTNARIPPADRKVHVPQGFYESDIVDSVLARLDIADLVIFNLTPKTGEKEASPNVFYELGLVHALGIPAIIVKGSRGTVPLCPGNAAKSGG